MASTTIDYGIDLGTTNSAIARQRGAAPELYRGPTGETILPSAVQLSAAGNATLGRAALAAIDADPANVAIEFKRLMGTEELRSFPASGQTRTPEELSAAILRELLGWAAAADGTTPVAAVITVPAMFQLPQCEATRRAAKLAGLAHAPLLQEPIAAAIAHSGSGDLREGYWMVYDLGGGTFDVSLVRSKAGRLQVLDHDGDNHLGGRDFDRLLARDAAERARAGGQLPELARTDPAYTAAFARLKAEAERVRVALSDADSARFQVALPGGTIAYDLTRADLEELIEATVLRTTALCKKLLDRGRVTAAELNGLVLVGGPSLTPIVPRVIREQLGIEARHAGDPMTIVARGAALVASTQRLPAELRAQRRVAGALGLELSFEAMTTDPAPLLVGRFDPAAVPAGTVLRLRREGGGFDTPVQLGAKGSFAVDLTLAQGQLNIFHFEARSAAGPLPVEPQQFNILHGLSVAKPPLSQSVGVMLADNKVCWYLKKGAVLPARNVMTHATTVALLAGQSGEAIHVPMLQGESGRADRNKIIGILHIKADKLTRDLPVGSEVEVTLNVDESSQTSGKAYVPLLGQTFDDVVLFKLETKQAGQVGKTLDEQKERLAKLEKMADDLEQAPEDADERVAEVQALIEEGDRDSIDLADQMVRMMSQDLDQAEEVGRARAIEAQFAERLADARSMVGEHGEPAEKRQLEALIVEFREAMKKHDHDLAQTKSDELDSLYSRVLLRQPEYWIGFFNYLSKKLTELGLARGHSDKFERGRHAIQTKQYGALTEVCLELMRLLPENARKEAGSPEVRSHIK